jgi:hypothetical protein
MYNIGIKDDESDEENEKTISNEINLDIKDISINPDNSANPDTPANPAIPANPSNSLSQVYIYMYI